MVRYTLTYEAKENDTSQEHHVLLAPHIHLFGGNRHQDGSLHGVMAEIVEPSIRLYCRPSLCFVWLLVCWS